MKLFKIPVAWLIGGLALVGTAAYVFVKGTSKSETKMLTKVPFNPDEDDCDAAYAMLPGDVQDLYNIAIGKANVAADKPDYPAKLADVKKIVQAIASNPDIDDIPKRTFQKCFWKKAVEDGTATPAEAIAAVPSLAAVFAGALGEGGGDDGDEDGVDKSGMTQIDEVIENTSQGEAEIGLDEMLAQTPQPAAPQKFGNFGAALGGIQLTTSTWPAIRSLPTSPAKTAALDAVSDVNYKAIEDQSLVPCLSDPSGSGSCRENRLDIMRDLKTAYDLVRDTDFGVVDAARRTAAMEELNRAYLMFYYMGA